MAKRAIYKANKMGKSSLSDATSLLTVADGALASFQTNQNHKISVKLPTVKLEPFSGYIETWQRF